MKLQRNEFLSHSGSMLDVLKIALPLVLSSSCNAVNMFMDRLMLTRYSQPSAAAAMTSGLTSFTLQCFFVGIVGYAGTFVAQYSGAKQPQRVCTAVWQGVFLALLGGAFMVVAGLCAPLLFNALHHQPEVTAQEIIYFRILAYGAVFFLLMQALSCFWSGRGKTTVVLVVSIVVTLLNLPFNYMLIYGRWGCPELGTAGAAWGTILAGLAGLIFYAIGFFCLKSTRRHFKPYRRIIDWEMFRRMLRFGSPNGVQMLLDLGAFNVFVLVISLYGVQIQEACSIVFGINNISFCPILGIGMTTSILVGQAIGAKNVELAKRSVRSARTLMFLYMTLMILLFVFVPNLFLAPFTRQGDASQLEVMRLARIMLIFIAAYLFGDGLAIVYSNAVRGAGDTKFIMYLTIFMSWGVFAIPCIVMRLCGASVWALWADLTAYILIFGTLCYNRYRSGKWTKMQVIEG